MVCVCVCVLQCAAVQAAGQGGHRLHLGRVAGAGHADGRGAARLVLAGRGERAAGRAGPSRVPRQQQRAARRPGRAAAAHGHARLPHARHHGHQALLRRRGAVPGGHAGLPHGEYQLPDNNTCLSPVVDRFEAGRDYDVALSHRTLFLGPTIEKGRKDVVRDMDSMTVLVVPMRYQIAIVSTNHFALGDPTPKFPEISEAKYFSGKLETLLQSFLFFFFHPVRVLCSEQVPYVGGLLTAAGAGGGAVPHSTYYHLPGLHPHGPSPLGVPGPGQRRGLQGRHPVEEQEEGMTSSTRLPLLSDAEPLYCSPPLRTLERGC